LLVPKHVNHVAANRWATESRRPNVTSEFVVVEVANFLSAKRVRTVFSGFLHALETDSRVTVAPSSSELFRRGCRLYLARSDKTWSLTDCISFEIMREHGIQDARTADKHFEQAGFNAMLKSDSPIQGDHH
jgi:predicted nucleic acid-binding protein